MANYIVPITAHGKNHLKISGVFGTVHGLLALGIFVYTFVNVMSVLRENPDSVVFGVYSATLISFFRTLVIFYFLYMSVTSIKNCSNLEKAAILKKFGMINMFLVVFILVIGVIQQITTIIAVNNYEESVLNASFHFIYSTIVLAILTLPMLVCSVFFIHGASKNKKAHNITMYNNEKC